MTGSMVIQEMILFFSASSGVEKGMLFSALQAMTQAWQAVHLSRSITIPQRGIVRSFTKPYKLLSGP
jgi:hypothetical protein